MRRMLALVVMLVLAALPAAVLQTPTATHAARYAYNTVVTGTLVATPQKNISATKTLLIQVGGRTMLVVVNGGTEYINRDNWPITLADLRNRAQLRITGNLSGSQIVAQLIQNMSLAGSPNLQIQGQQLSAVPATWQTNLPLCVSGGLMRNGHRVVLRGPGLATCGNGMALYLTTGTRFLDNAGRTINRSLLQPGHTLSITAVLNGGRLVALVIKDTSISATTTTTLTGQVVATPQNPNAGNVSFLLQVNGQTVLVLAGSQTQVIDSNSSPLTLASLRNQDQVRVIGDYNGSQIVATSIQDLSLPGVVTLQITGQVATPLPTLATGPLCVSSATVTNLQQPLFRTQLANPCGNNLPVYLTGSTSFVDNNGQATSLAALMVGDNLTITAALNAGQITASRVQDLTPPAPIKVTVTGQVASPLAAQVPGPLCVSSATVTNSSQPMIRALTSNPCGSNLPVYLTNSTNIMDNNAQSTSLNALQVGDNVTITGTLNAGTLTASSIQDLTPPAPVNLQITGLLAGPLPTQVPGPLCVSSATITGSSQSLIRPQVTNPCGSNLALYISNSTVLQNNGGQAVSLNALRTGDSLSVLATLSNGQLTATYIQDHSF